MLRLSGARLRPLLRLSPILLAVLLLALAERGGRLLRAHYLAPTAGAAWIWLPEEPPPAAPVAFSAVRDFRLAAPPAAARLLVAADEEYLLSLNGKPVGSGAWRPGAPLDVYEVGDLLLDGANRLVAELRSSRGAGGFLLSLEVPGRRRPLVATDGSWRLFRHAQPGLVEGWWPSGPGEPALVWGVPPTGRWGSPGPSAPRPLFARLIAAWEPVPAAAESPLDLSSASVPPDPRALGAATLGRTVLFDWGREVTGYLELDFAPEAAAAPPPTSLVFTGTAAPPDPLAERPAIAAVCMPGETTWSDARPRRFRYVAVVGLRPLVGAGVVELAAPVALAADSPPESGVLGIRPPRLPTPVEDEVWRKLKRPPPTSR